MAAHKAVDIALAAAHIAPDTEVAEASIHMPSDHPLVLHIPEMEAALSRTLMDRPSAEQQPPETLAEHIPAAAHSSVFADTVQVEGIASPSVIFDVLLCHHPTRVFSTLPLLQHASGLAVTCSGGADRAMHLRLLLQERPSRLDVAVEG